MDCFCGCGTKVPRGLTSANVKAAELALELLAWDKARTATPPAAPVTAETEQLIARGADRFQQLIAAIHGEEVPDPLPACEDWLDDSFDARKDRRDITTKGSLLRRARLNLTEPDYERLDRKRPERSFSRHIAAPAESSPADGDPVEQLRGLRELHAAGALTDEEFSAAKARVIARLDS